MTALSAVGAAMAVTSAILFLAAAFVLVRLIGWKATTVVFAVSTATGAAVATGASLLGYL